MTTPIPPPGLPLMADAAEISVADIPTLDLRAVIAAETGDQLYAIPGADDAFIYVRLRAADSHWMYASSCEVLTSVELPEGWMGTCLERTVDGQRVSGEFSYHQALE